MRKELATLPVVALNQKANWRGKLFTIVLENFFIRELFLTRELFILKPNFMKTIRF